MKHWHNWAIALYFVAVLAPAVLYRHLRVDAVRQQAQQAMEAEIQAVQDAPWEAFFLAVRMVEGGGPDNPLQIERAFWEEGCRQAGLPYPYSDRWDYWASCEVARGYFERYCPQAVVLEDWHTLARVFRKGPSGQHSRTAREYADRVCNLMRAGAQ